MTRKTLSAKCRVWLIRKQKLLLAHRNKLHVADRDGHCAARSGVDQRHLAEDGVVRQCLEHAIAEADLDTAALNDEQPLGIVTLTEDDVARLKFTHWYPGASQYPKNRSARPS